MTARLVGCTLSLLVALAAGAAHADRCPTTIAFPGWNVTTSEDAWANEALKQGVKRYPISNLFDGDPATAWVFEGPKWNETEGAYRSPTGHAFQGGLDQWVEIRSLADTPSLVDGVGIVNGYPKTPAAYLRNNRITRVRLETGPPWKPSWGRTFDLEPAMHMQIVRFPAMRADGIRVRVARVQRGRDNDLCISEIQLFHEGRALIAPPPPYLLYSPGDECGCGFSMGLVDRRGRPAAEGPLAACHWPTFRFSPDGRLLAVTCKDERVDLAVADLRTGACLVHLPDLGDVSQLEWAGGRTLRFRAEAADGSRARCEVDLSAHTPQVTRSPAPRE